MSYAHVDPVKKGCNRCGSKTVAWQQSDEGKWYLIEVFTRDGMTVGSRTDFHSTYCNKPEKHEARQAELDGDQRNERRQRISNTRKAREEAADELLSWYSLELDAVEREIVELERSIENFKRNPPTMDFMVEFERETAAHKMNCVKLQVMQARIRNERGQ